MKINKQALWEGRMGRCDYRGCELPYPTTDWNNVLVHVHHCLVYKSDLPKSKQHTEAGSIDEPINLMLVCHECHSLLQSDRAAGRDFKVAQYGEEAVDAYVLRMLPKTHQLRGVRRAETAEVD